jgi:hypothetical protein
MHRLKIDILPHQPEYYSVDGEGMDLDYESICIWAAIGFYLGESTFYRGLKVCQPGYEYVLDNNRRVLEKREWFAWYHEPENVSLPEVVDEFADHLSTISHSALDGKRVILPVSGGLDSRTLASALRNRNDVHAFSYEYFRPLVKETQFAKKVAEAAGFGFEAFQIPTGYLWSHLDSLAKANGCYCEFTHARPAPVLAQVAGKGDIFCLGHWGDVLFDGSHVECSTNDELTEIVKKKIVKKGGLELASSLWAHWGLPGGFEPFLRERIYHYLARIRIESPPAKLRAFKSLHWAPRWTAANLGIFTQFKPVFLPYFQEEMCRLVCKTSEDLLSGRQVQIEYLKKYAPDLAAIPWQKYAPYNLYSFHLYHTLRDFPRRGISWMKSQFQRAFNKPMTTMNWQSQFLGLRNQASLKEVLTRDANFTRLVSKPIIEDFYERFTRIDSTYYSHPISMLVTLASFVRLRET